MSDTASGTIEYEPVIGDCWKIGDEHTRSAGCAVCWAGCLLRGQFGPLGNYPDAWWWMHRTSVLTDKALICADDSGEEACLLSQLPHPLRVHDLPVMLSSQIHSDDRIATGRQISQHAALPWYQNYFLFAREGRTESELASDEWCMSDEELEQPAIEAYVLSGASQPNFYLPVHDACMQLLNRFLEAQVDPGRVRTLPDFYDSIATSFRAWSMANRYARPRELELDFDEIQLRSRVGEREACYFSFHGLWRSEPDWQALLFADPCDVPDYTEALLSDAPRFDGEDTSSPTALERLLRQLPQELMNQILQELCPLEGLQTKCNRLLSPHFWTDLLITSVPLPFLWDLDKHCVLHADKAIDWEMFVRLLAQSDPFEGFSSAPRGLRNRHSIWKSLEGLSVFRPSRVKGCDIVAELSNLHVDRSGGAVPSQYNQDDYHTALNIEWMKRTDEERQLWGTDADEDTPGGHWTVHWSRMSPTEPE